MPMPKKKLKGNNDLCEPSTSSKSNAEIIYIKDLSTLSKTWMIIGCVFFKSALRSFNNKNGKGYRFSFDIKDTSGEIRITSFNDTAKYLYELIVLNKSYSISNGKVQITNPQYKQLNNDFEIILSPFSDVKFVDSEKANQLSTNIYDFKTIQQIFELPLRSICAIIAIVISIDELELVFKKNSNEQLKKRTLHLLDDTETPISLTLWAEEAEPKESIFICGQIILGKFYKRMIIYYYFINFFIYN